MSGLGQVDLLKLERILWLCTRQGRVVMKLKQKHVSKFQRTHRSLSVIVLSLCLHLNGGCVLNYTLDRHLYELIEGVQLLADQTLLFKV